MRKSKVNIPFDWTRRIEDEVEAISSVISDLYPLGLTRVHRAALRAQLSKLIHDVETKVETKKEEEDGTDRVVEGSRP